MHGQKRYDDAMPAYRRAMALFERLAKEFPRVVDYTIGLGGGACNLGHV